MSSLRQAISRTVRLVHNNQKVPQWGGYISVTDPDVHEFDPFIFLVHHVHSFPPGEETGFPAHPHRGFETVTYIIEGGFDHGDSKGNKGRYGDGDVQWLTTGKGVLHSEMFVTHPTKTSTFNGFQLWLNLPSKLKMSEPDYQMLWAKDIPKFKSSDKKVEAVVIAGELGDAKSTVKKATPLSYFHLKIQAGGRISIPSPKDHTCLTYIFEGEATLGPSDAQRKVPSNRYAIFEKDGDSVEIENQGSGLLQLLLLEGKPFGEPIAHQGPFVMNTRDELRQAFIDYQRGLFGRMD